MRSDCRHIPPINAAMLASNAALPRPRLKMVSLARATLRHEWRRFLAAVLAVAFSGLLVLVQLGLRLAGEIRPHGDHASAPSPARGVTP